MTGAAPDVAGVVVGWRTWQVPDPGPAGSGPARLRSPVKVSTEWIPGAALVAQCELRGHPAPEPLCTCGLYAARDPADVGGVGFGRVTLLGCVAMWGTVVEGERGWRGGVGRPVVLFCGPALADDVRSELAAAYGVSVHRLHRPVAATVEQTGTRAAAERLRTVLGGAPPDLRLVDDAARAFVDAAGRPEAGAAGRSDVASAGRAGVDAGRAPSHRARPPAPDGRNGRGRRRTAVGTALFAAVAASALLLLPPAQGAPAPATPPSATPIP